MQVDVLYDMLALRRAPGEFQPKPAYETSPVPALSLNERALAEVSVGSVATNVTLILSLLECFVVVIH